MHVATADALGRDAIRVYYMSPEVALAACHTPSNIMPMPDQYQGVDNIEQLCRLVINRFQKAYVDISK